MNDLVIVRDKKYDSKLVIASDIDNPGKLILGIEGEDADFGVVIGKKKAARLVDALVEYIASEPSHE